MTRRLIILFALSWMLSACSTGLKSTTPASKINVQLTEMPVTSPTHVLPTVTIPSITGVAWDIEGHFFEIGVAPWPQFWEPWIAYVDGRKIITGENEGELSVRPNAPLEMVPNGVILGTLPWVSGLDQANVPCCGSIQFMVPGIGMTDKYEYNLLDQGCVTASNKICAAEWTVHEGDWIIEGPDPITIENSKIIQKGNIYIRDGASLILRNSTLRLVRGDTPTIHVYIFVDPKATLEIDRSIVEPGPGDSGLACVINRGKTVMVDSPTSIHYFDMSDGAELVMQNSEMIGEIGGLLQMGGGSAKLANSTIGALGINVPAGARLDISGLQSGAYFEHWTVQEWIPEARYVLTFDQVTVLKDDFSGEYEHGPFERGWIFFLDPNAHVKLSNSQLRKVFIDLRNETATFSNLKIGEPSSLSYRDILLDNVVVQGQWPFTIINSTLTVENSNYLFLQPMGSSTIKLVNSHIVEFIPREFTGVIIFENGTWTNAGEIIGDVDYHSRRNQFVIKGSLKLGEELREHLQWKSAQVVREFEVLFSDSQGKPINNGVVKINEMEYRSDETGSVKFTLNFDEHNYDQLIKMEVWISGVRIDERLIDFFTETPITIIQ